MNPDDALKTIYEDGSSDSAFAYGGVLIEEAEKGSIKLEDIANLAVCLQFYLFYRGYPGFCSQKFDDARAMVMKGMRWYELYENLDVVRPMGSKLN